MRTLNWGYFIHIGMLIILNVRHLLFIVTPDLRIWFSIKSILTPGPSPAWLMIVFFSYQLYALLRTQILISLSGSHKLVTLFAYYCQFWTFNSLNTPVSIVQITWEALGQAQNGNITTQYHNYLKYLTFIALYSSHMAEYHRKS